MAASTEPVIRRKFILAEFDGNHNKEWQIELWADGTCVTTWGRVGDSPQAKTFTGWTSSRVESKVAEKERKGYREISLHVPTVTSVTTAAAPRSSISASVDRLLELIFREAGEHIKTYLAVSVDALSQEQIEEGRKLLAEYDARMDHKRSQSAGDAASKGVVPIVQRYYNTIPTIAPRKIDGVQLAHAFNTEEQENRLNQLEAALATITGTATAPAGTSHYDMLGVEIKEVEGKEVKDFFARTSRFGNLRQVFEVTIPNERRRFEGNKRGISHIASLWHGTKAANVRHILKAGFKVPDHYSNGWMFGPGVYFADKALKSQGYASHQFGTTMMFLSDVAIGNPYVAPQAESLKAAPSGYDSVWGREGHTKSWGGTLQNNEFIVYDAAQTTIRYIVTY